MRIRVHVRSRFVTDDEVRSDGPTAVEGDVRASVEAIAELVRRLVEERQRDLSVSSARRSARLLRMIRDARVQAAVDPGELHERVRRRARLAIDDIRIHGFHRIDRRSSTSSMRPSTTRQRYFIHIGAPKCGSTYLQSLLWRNRVPLARDDVYVPGATQGDHFLAGSDVLGTVTSPEAAALDSWRGAWDRLIRDAERSQCSTIVITDETLCRATAEQARTALDRLRDHEVHIVYATRDLAGLLPSQWQSGALWGPVPAFARWLRARVLDHPDHWFWESHDLHRVFRNWSTGDPANVHVVIVPSMERGDEMWRRFQSVLGWSTPTRTDQPRSNSSIGFSQIELLRRVQQRIAGVEPRLVRRRITEAVIGLGVLAQQPRIDVPLIPHDLRERIEAMADDRRAFITGSGFDVIGDIEELANPSARFAAAPAVPSPEAMLAAGRAVTETLERHLVARHHHASLMAVGRALVRG